ncbi:MAG: DUF1989 domain-containing protein [Sandaracinobacteroides sp.]
MNRIPPRSGVAFVLKRGEQLTVIDPQGEQVSDMLLFSNADPAEFLSSGRSLDYAETLFLTSGNILYSNRSRPMMRIGEDQVGRHDFLLTPCSRDTFRIMYGDMDPHRGCHGNLAAALEPYGIGPDRIVTAFNIFMNVDVDPASGRLQVLAPRSKPGQHVRFVAEMDLIVGLTACSALQSNNGSFKPIDYAIAPAAAAANIGATAEADAD